MTEMTLSPGLKWRLNAETALTFAGRFWFVTAVIGQWIFAVYVAILYGGAVAKGDMEAFSSVMPNGYVEGEPFYNFFVVLHMLFAVVIMIGGPLQFVQPIRSRFPAFHHWNGRIYFFTAVTTSLGGFYMLLTHGTVGGVATHSAMIIITFLVLVFAAIALQRAITRQIDSHRRWIFRLFMAVSAVWFFRIGLMFWLFVNGGPAGFDPETFTGPFVNFLAFAQFLLPLAVVELYLGIKDRGNAFAKYTMAGTLALFAMATGLGIFAATMGLWLPRL